MTRMITTKRRSTKTVLRMALELDIIDMDTIAGALGRQPSREDCRRYIHEATEEKLSRERDRQDRAATELMSVRDAEEME